MLNLVISPSSSLFVYISGSSFKVLRLRKVKTPVFGVLDMHHLPVDSARTLIWFDIHLVVVDVNLRDVHLKVIGQELDWFPHCANARPSRCLEHLLQRGQVCACSYKAKRLVRVKSGHILTLLSETQLWRMQGKFLSCLPKLTERFHGAQTSQTNFFKKFSPIRKTTLVYLKFKWICNKFLLHVK